ncbi:hypothetical protein LO762_29370 [Actinocorallia sp. API 0066]|uniref:hypothetical protein n=1 Tax=Actinocorallia sp. API 0066 TaxID=2896846 RepID=UPI001E637501|nr:hypothetical protein [Actinocorallia sp. API 0066]MCD0453261.1 hypothetical protein [Actinocorallia sp. API 0066]
MPLDHPLGADCELACLAVLVNEHSSRSGPGNGARVINAARREGCATVGHIAVMAASGELRDLRNVGPVSFAAVTEILAEHGMDVAPPDPWQQLMLHRIARIERLLRERLTTLTQED